MDDRRTLREWTADHKTELVIAGSSVAIVVAAFFGIKYRAKLEKLMDKKRTNGFEPMKSVNHRSAWHENLPVHQENSVVKCLEAQSRAAHDVKKHIRNLPPGRTASAGKIASANKNGFVLLPGQTWVDAYSTGALAA